MSGSPPLGFTPINGRPAQRNDGSNPRPAEAAAQGGPRMSSESMARFVGPTYRDWMRVDHQPRAPPAPAPAVTARPPSSGSARRLSNPVSGPPLTRPTPLVSSQVSTPHRNTILPNPALVVEETSKTVPQGSVLGARPELDRQAEIPQNLVDLLTSEAQSSPTKALRVSLAPERRGSLETPDPPSHIEVVSAETFNGQTLPHYNIRADESDNITENDQYVGTPTQTGAAGRSFVQQQNRSEFDPASRPRGHPEVPNAGSDAPSNAIEQSREDPQLRQLMQLARQYGGVAELQKRLERGDVSPNTPGPVTLPHAGGLLSTNSNAALVASNTPTSSGANQSLNLASIQTYDCYDPAFLLKVAAITENNLRNGSPLFPNMPTLAWSSIGRSRWTLLIAAARALDVQFLLMHQLFAKKQSAKFDHGLDTAAMKGLDILWYILGKVQLTQAQGTDSHAWTQFGSFPAPWSAILSSSQFTFHLEEAKQALRQLGERLGSFMVEVRDTRGIPHVWTIMDRFRMSSATLQRILRAFGLRTWWTLPFDQCWAQLGVLFMHEQNEIRTQTQDATVDQPAFRVAERNIRNKYSKLYVDLIHRHERDHRGQASAAAHDQWTGEAYSPSIVFPQPPIRPQSAAQALTASQRTSRPHTSTIVRGSYQPPSQIGRAASAAPLQNALQPPPMAPPANHPPLQVTPVGSGVNHGTAGVAPAQAAATLQRQFIIEAPRLVAAGPAAHSRQAAGAPATSGRQHVGGRRASGPVPHVTAATSAPQQQQRIQQTAQLPLPLTLRVIDKLASAPVFQLPFFAKSGELRPSEAPNVLSAAQQAHLRSPTLKPVDRDSKEMDGNKTVMYSWVAGLLMPRPFIISRKFEQVEGPLSIPPETLAAIPKRIAEADWTESRIITSGSHTLRVRCLKLPSRFKTSEKLTEAQYLSLDPSLEWPDQLAAISIISAKSRKGINALDWRTPHKGHFKAMPIDISDKVFSNGNLLSIICKKARFWQDLETRTEYVLCAEDITYGDEQTVQALIGAFDRSVTPARIKALLQRPSSSSTPTAGNSGHGNNDDEDDDLQIVTSVLTVPVRDPLTARLPKDPVRSVECVHIECFDLAAFLSTRALKDPEGFRCPCCGADARPPKLRRDAWMRAVVAACSEDTELIEVDADANWKVKETRPGGGGGRDETRAARKRRKSASAGQDGDMDDEEHDFKAVQGEKAPFSSLTNPSNKPLEVIELD